MSARRRLTIVLAMVAAACGGSGSAAHAAGGDFFGANVQPMVKLEIPPVPQARWDTFLGAMAGDGLVVARADVLWSAVEPNAPDAAGNRTYTWNRPGDPGRSMDTVVGALARRSVRLLAVITTPPSWAGSGGTRVTPDHYDDLAAFAGAVAARYGSQGSFWNEHPELPRVPVREYQYWNEVNSTHSWTGSPNAAEYAAGLRLAYPAIHAADPNAKVLTSIGWQDFENFTSALYANGAKGTLDGYGFNPYGAHVSAILDLVTRMRKRLAELGDGALPIYVTEVGQPRVRTGPGATHTYEGLPSDETRAGNLAAAAEALARSNCGVEDFLVYTTVGDEADGQPGEEGYMGVYRVADARPNATGAALGDASRRWRADQRGGLALCGGGTTAARDLLPLGLEVTRTSATCARAVVSFYGNPLESAQLRLRTEDGRAVQAETNAFGTAEACLPGGEPATFEAWAELPNVAASGTASCTTTGSRCSVTAPPGTGSPAGTPGATGPASAATCRGKLTLRMLKAGRRSARVRARVACADARTLKGRTRFSVFVQRRGSQRKRFVRRITLSGQRSASFTIKVRLRRKDRLVFVRPADRRTGAWLITATVTAR